MIFLSGLRLLNLNPMNRGISAVSYTHLDVYKRQDKDSLDQSRITQNLIKNKNVKLINLRTQQTISALLDGTIDAGVWNYDDIIENHRVDNLKIVFLAENEYNNLFSTAVIVIRKGDSYLAELLRKTINVETTLKILKEVREGIREPYF